MLMNEQIYFVHFQKNFTLHLKLAREKESIPSELKELALVWLFVGSPNITVGYAYDARMKH